jgi:hypothetical protein
MKNTRGFLYSTWNPPRNVFMLDHVFWAKVLAGNEELRRLVVKIVVAEHAACMLESVKVGFIPQEGKRSAILWRTLRFSYSPWHKPKTYCLLFKLLHRF